MFKLARQRSGYILGAVEDMLIELLERLKDFREKHHLISFNMKHVMMLARYLLVNIHKCLSLHYKTLHNFALFIPIAR